MDIEKSIKQIEELKSKIEDNTTSFELKLDYFKQSQKLIQECREYLSKVELQIEEVKSNSL